VITDFLETQISSDFQLVLYCHPDQREFVLGLTRLRINQQKLDDLLAYCTQGAIVRSRACWVEYGEKSIKYFFNLEKYVFEKSIKSLKNAPFITNDSLSIL